MSTLTATVLDEAEFLASDPDILGGEPVIRGTRITCRAVRQRLEGSETLDNLCEDYPSVPAEAFLAAATYAKAHLNEEPPVSGKPWRRSKPIYQGRI